MMGLSGPHDLILAFPSFPPPQWKKCFPFDSTEGYISPRTKHMPKWWWGEASKPGPKTEATRDARRCLLYWVEAETLRHLSAKYYPMVPPPRSTIAAAFSPDGRTLASTHVDHTVKIIDCQTGCCLRVFLIGHRRTPWVSETSSGDRSDCLNNKVGFQEERGGL